MLLFLGSLFASLFTHFAHLHQTAPVLLGSTLAGITFGLLALRLLDGRCAPVFFHLSALVVAMLALAHLGGLVPLGWPMSVACGAVVLLLVQEVLYLLSLLLAQMFHRVQGLFRLPARFMGRDSQSAPVSSLRYPRQS